MIDHLCSLWRTLCVRWSRLSRSLQLRYCLVTCVASCLSACAIFSDWSACQRDADCPGSLSFCAADQLCKRHQTPQTLPARCQLTAGRLEESAPIGMLVPLSGPHKPFGEGLFLSAELAIETINRDTSGPQLSLVACDSHGVEPDELTKPFEDLKIDLIVGPILSQTVTEMSRDSSRSDQLTFLSPNLSADLVKDSKNIYSFTREADSAQMILNLTAQVINEATAEDDRVDVFWISNIDSAYNRALYEELVSLTSVITDERDDQRKVESTFISYSDRMPYSPLEVSSRLRDHAVPVMVYLDHKDAWDYLRQQEVALEDTQKKGVYLLSEWSLNPQSSERQRGYEDTELLEGRVLGVAQRSLFALEGDLGPQASLFQSTFNTRFYLDPQYLPYSGRVYDLIFLAAWIIGDAQRKPGSMRESVTRVIDAMKVSEERIMSGAHLSCRSAEGPSFCVNPEGLSAVIESSGERWLMGASGPLLPVEVAPQSLTSEELIAWCLYERSFLLLNDPSEVSRCIDLSEQTQE